MSIDAVLGTFANASAEDVEQIIKALTELPQRDQHAADQAKMKAKHGLKGAKAMKTITKIEKRGGGPKRPLNAFMCWRKYYGPMLSPLTQRVKSKIMSVLWKADPFHGKWALLAKGYSDLRGNREKSEVPLDEYLMICAPIVGVLSPEIYMASMGWTLGSADGNDEAIPTPSRSFGPSVEILHNYYTTTTYSADDLVKHCIDKCLVKVAGETSTSAQTGTLSMAVQPSTTAAVDSEINETTFDDHDVPIELDASHFYTTGESTLNAAAIAFESTNNFTCAAAFDPTSNFDITFDPAANDQTYDDGGIFDSFDMEGAFAINQQVDAEFDFSAFINEDSTASFGGTQEGERYSARGDWEFSCIVSCKFGE